METSRGNVPLRKLGEIVVKDVEFCSTPLGNALEFLHHESRRLDTSTDEADQRGVAIWLVDGGELPPCPIPDLPPATPRVTLALRDVNLGDAICAVAVAGGMRVRVDGAGVLVAARSKPDASAHC